MNPYGKSGAIRGIQDVRAIFNDLPILMLVFDESRNEIVEWNRPCETATGYSRKEALHSPDFLEKLFPEKEHRDRTITQWKQKNLRFIGEENELTCKDGSSKKFSWTSIRAPFAYGNYLIFATKTVSPPTDPLIKESRGEIARLIAENLYESINICEFNLIDKSKKLIAFNDLYLQMTGRSQEELLEAYDLTWLAMTALSKEKLGHFQQCLLHCQPYRGISSWYRPDKKDNYFEWFAIPVYLDETTRLLIGLDRDITEMIQSQQALRETEARLSDVLNASADIIYRLDLKTLKYDYLSPACLQQFGFSAEELEEKGRDFILDRFHPDDLARISPLIQKIRQGPFDENIHETVEYRFLHRDGQYRWFSDSRTLVFDEEGDPVALVGNVHNITRSKLAEEQLRESERRYGNLFEYAPTALWVQDFSGLKTHFDTLRNNGVDDLEKYFMEHPVDVLKCSEYLNILDINQTTLKMYGVKEKKEFFEKIEAFFTSEGIGPFRDQIIALVNGNTFFETESVNRTLSGQPLHVALRWVIPPGYEDTWKRVYVSITNITRRKEAEEALAQIPRKLLEIRESEREHLARELHDAIGQQLIAMHLSQQALFAANRDQMDDSSKQSLQSLIQQCHQLIRDLRGICHGLYPPTLESLGLPGALRQLANEIPMGVSLAVRCNPPADALRFEPQVEIDLFRIVQEALSNALRHSQADRIEIDLKYDGKMFYLQISDNGNGFDPACPPNLGMGLDTMKERAKVFHGDLRIYSNPRGTNLVLVAPIKPIH